MRLGVGGLALAKAFSQAKLDRAGVEAHVEAERVFHAECNESRSELGSGPTKGRESDA
jgi:hypothetical protein